MKKNILFILNPKSGSIQKHNVVTQIHENIDRKIYNYDIAYTHYAGHASEIAAEASRFKTEVIVAIGGDGTVNEVGKSLVNTPSVLGIIPAGSGNGLARHLGISMQLAEALHTLNTGKIIRIDTCMMNEKAFFCTAGAGFDAHVSAVFSKQKSRGLKTYIKTCVSEFSSYKPQSFVIETEKERIEETAFVITVANAGQYGNNAYIAPQADIEDGLMDICIIRPTGIWGTTKVARQLFKGTLPQSPFYRTFRTDYIKIKRSAKGMIHVDGEPMAESEELICRIFPKSLQVIVP